MDLVHGYPHDLSEFVLRTCGSDGRGCNAIQRRMLSVIIKREIGKEVVAEMVNSDGESVW